MNKIGKYEFTNESTAKSKIAALGTATDEDGNTYPTHKHCIVELGNIVITPGDYDEEGSELAPPVKSVMYHVDVLWKDLTINEDGDLPYCNYFVWRIVFEELPKQLQLRIPTLEIVESFNPVETPDYQETYVALYADLGYTVTIDTESDTLYLADYGSDWEALYPSHQFAIERYVYQQLIEQYPPETTPYALDWEYTYNLRD